MRFRAATAAACAVLLTQPVRGQQLATNLTAAELAYASSLGAARQELGTFGSLPQGGGQWSGIAYAPSVDLLFGAPRGASAVLVINPRTDAVDGDTLSDLGTFNPAWNGIVYVPSVDMLFAAPFDADAVLMINPQTNATDNTTLGGLSVGGAKWFGIAHAPSVDLLYGVPFDAPSVLIVNPRTNVTDTAALVNLPPGGGKWIEMVYVASQDMLYAAPYDASSVLMINPSTNVTDTITLSGLGTDSAKWWGITFASSVDLLFAAPFNSNAVLIINPRTNVTDTSAISGVMRPNIGSKWAGIVHIPAADLLVAAPRNADSVLTINLRTNTTENISVASVAPGVGAIACKWRGITAVPSGTAFAPPCDAGTVLTVRFVVEASLIEPFRLIAQLTANLASTSSALSSSIVAQASTQAIVNSTTAALSVSVAAQSSTATALSSSVVAQVSTQAVVNSTATALSVSVAAQSSIAAALSSSVAALTSMQAQLLTVGDTVCNRPVCSSGTRPENGTCVPDCPNLQRRGLSCEPFCDAAGGGGDDEGEKSLIGPIVGAIGCAIVVGLVVTLIRRQSAQHETLREMVSHPQSTAMYVNPLHRGAEPTETASNNNFVEPAPNAAPIVLDQQMYVGKETETENSYNVFQSSENGTYTVFKDIQANDTDDASA